LIGNNELDCDIVKTSQGNVSTVALLNAQK